MEVEVAEEETTRMRDASRAACPEAAQMLDGYQDCVAFKVLRFRCSPELTIITTCLVVWLARAAW